MKKLLATLSILFGLCLFSPAFAADPEANDAKEDVILYVDINSDSAEKMADLLSGIGLKKANDIVMYRQKNGPFETVEDLLNVKGVGPSILNKNRAAIIVGEVD